MEIQENETKIFTDKIETPSTQNEILATQNKIPSNQNKIPSNQNTTPQNPVFVHRNLVLVAEIFGSGWMTFGYERYVSVILVLKMLS